MKPSTTQNNQVALIKQELETRRKVLTEIGKQCVNQDEVNVIKAQLDVPIKYLDYSVANNKKKIIALLVEWAYMVGANDNSSDATTEAQIFNAKFLITNYGSMTVYEIKQAIQWSVVGKLEVDVNPYGKLTPMYMARILNKYLDKRDIINGILRAKHHESVAKKKHEEQFKNEPYEKRVKAFRVSLIDYMTKMKNNRMEDVAGSLVWKFLSRAEKVNEKMFNVACREYAKEKLQAYKIEQRDKGLAKTITPEKNFEKDEYYILRYMQDYCIYMVLESINDISGFVNAQPDEIVLPKN